MFCFDMHLILEFYLEGEFIMKPLNMRKNAMQVLFLRLDTQWQLFLLQLMQLDQ